MRRARPPICPAFCWPKTSIVMISPARSLPIIPSASLPFCATPAGGEQPVSAPSAPRSAVCWRGPVPNAPADPTVTALRRAGGPLDGRTKGGGSTPADCWVEPTRRGWQQPGSAVPCSVIVISLVRTVQPPGISQTVRAMQLAPGARRASGRLDGAHLRITVRPVPRTGLDTGGAMGRPARMSHRVIRSSERQCRREQPRDRSNGARVFGNHGERRRSIFGALHTAIRHPRRFNGCC